MKLNPKLKPGIDTERKSIGITIPPAQNSFPSLAYQHQPEVAARRVNANQVLL